MTQQRKLTITLDRSRNSRAFASGENLWVKELYRILQMVRNHTASLGSLRAPGKRGSDGIKPQDPRPCLSIAIFGPSGSGKSSLLRTLEYHVNKGWFQEIEREFRREDDDACHGDGRHRREPGSFSRLENRVRSLPVMQPDRFAEYDDFLYAFLASALKEEKEYREARYDDEDQRRLAPDALSPVQQAFQDLSEFLRVIDEPETSQDYDPLGLSLERLERHTSGLLLREKINDFIERLADELAGKGRKDDSVILLPVDDADMSPEHLVKTLKTYQSYLLHPRLVPVFTFTDRTAEETLRVYFKSYLSTPVSGKDHRSEPLVFEEAGEGTQQLPVSEQLALQYLSRCFPVRTRIRLGPAPARLRLAQYRHRTVEPPDKRPDHGESCRCSECDSWKRQREQRERQTETYDVSRLLDCANRVLFGCPDRKSRHELRAVLRPSTLRRQLHVLDEVAAAGMERLVPERSECSQKTAGTGKEEKTKPRGRSRYAPFLEPGRRWVDIYHRTVWSMMNVHRDVLREFDLYLEDLYSWTPQGLQRVVLDILLQQDLEVRRALLRRWRFRTDSRRGQTLSLLAANMFRPWMPGEEPYGDVSYARHYEPHELQEIHEGGSHVTAMTATLWFLRLSIGFYLPQVLAENRPTDIARTRPDRGRILGIGWDLLAGPVNGVLAAESENNLLATGIIFTDPRCTADALRVEDWLTKWKALWSLRRSADTREKVETFERVHLQILDAGDRLRTSAKRRARNWEKGRDETCCCAEICEICCQDSAYCRPEALREEIAKLDVEGRPLSGLMRRMKSTLDLSDDTGEWTVEPEDLERVAHLVLADWMLQSLGRSGTVSEPLPGSPDPVDRIIRQVSEIVEPPVPTGEGEAPDPEERAAAAQQPTARRETQPRDAIRDRASESAILVRCWTYYGYGRGRYWAAVSFWRGLGLIGQLLEARRRYTFKRRRLQSELRAARGTYPRHDGEAPELRRLRGELSQELAREGRDWKKEVRGVLRTHLIRGMVPGEMLGRIEDEDRLDLAFERWDVDEFQLELVEGGPEPPDNFLRRIVAWLDGLEGIDEGGENDVLPFLLPRIPEEYGPGSSKCRWSRSLMRRLHGDDVVGDLMARMNAAYIEEQGEYEVRGFGESGGRRVPRRYRWNSLIAMVSWTRTLLEYWRGLFPVQKLLRTCPLLAPFVDGPMLDDLRRELMQLTPGSVMTMEHSTWDDFSIDWNVDLAGSKLDAATIEDVKGVLKQSGHGLGTILEGLGGAGSRLIELNLEEQEVDRQLRWLGLVDREDRIEVLSGSRGVDQELHELLQGQFRAVLRGAPALQLFHRVPRVLNEDFRPLDSPHPKYVHLSPS